MTFDWLKRLCSTLYNVLRRRKLWIKKEVKVEYWTRRDAEAELEITGVKVKPAEERSETVYVDRVRIPVAAPRRRRPKKAVHQDIGKFMRGIKRQHKWYRRSVKAKVQPEED